MVKITLKICGKKKITYEAKPLFTDNGLVLDAIDEQMFVPYAQVEYIIIKKEQLEKI